VFAIRHPQQLTLARNLIARTCPEPPTVAMRLTMNGMEADSLAFPVVDRGHLVGAPCLGRGVRCD
jgi:hypothetical protein